MIGELEAGIEPEVDRVRQTPARVDGDGQVLPEPLKEGVEVERNGGPIDAADRRLAASWSVVGLAGLTIA